MNNTSSANLTDYSSFWSQAANSTLLPNTPPHNTAATLPTPPCTPENLVSKFSHLDLRGVSITPPSHSFYSKNLKSSQAENIESSKFGLSDLERHSIRFSWVDNAKTYSLSTLLKEGFGSFPFALLSTRIPLHPFALGFADANPKKEMVDDQATTSDIKVEWCQPGEGIELTFEGQAPIRDVISGNRINTLMIAVSTWSPSFTEVSEDALSPSVRTLTSLFGVGVGNNHTLQHALYRIPKMSTVKPDCAAGPFQLTGNSSVTSLLNTPMMRETAAFLGKMRAILPQAIGCPVILALPTIVGEFKKKEQVNHCEDVCKLLVEMAIVRSSWELIWSKPPPFNLGFYVAHNTWRIYIMRQDPVTQKLVVGLLFKLEIGNHLDLLYVSTVCFRLAEYMYSELAKVELVSLEHQEEILAQIRQIRLADTRDETNKKTTKKTTRTTTKTTTVSKKSEPRTKKSRKDDPDDDDQPDEDKSYGTDGKENEEPNSKHKTALRHNQLQLELVHKNIYVTCYDNTPAILKTGSIRAIKREVDFLLEFRGQYFAEVLACGVLDKTKCCLVERKYVGLPQPSCVEDMLRISTQLLMALSGIHGRNYLHGDVKNSNIVWDEEAREIRLIDFETAKCASKSEKVKGYFGTKPFMAPEVIQEKWVSHKSDVFSAALVIASLIYNVRIDSTTAREHVISLVHNQQRSNLATPLLLATLSKMLAAVAESRVSSAEALRLLLGTKTEARKVPAKNIQPVVAKRVPLGNIGNRVNQPRVPTQEKSNGLKMAAGKENEGVPVQKVVLSNVSQRRGLAVRK